MLILLYVLDALRSDHLSCYGYGRKTSPNIDSLAKDGVTLLNCYSPSTWTRPSAASLLTGVYPPGHGARTRNIMFSSSIPRLPEYLQRLDYKTAAFSTIGNVSRASGFSRGFDDFFDIFLDEEFFRSGRMSNTKEEGLLFETQNSKIGLPLAEDINQCLLPWVGENLSKRNLFLLAWSIQTHVPFSPPTDFARFVDFSYSGNVTGKREDIKKSLSREDINHLVDLYDSEIYYNDHCLGEILSNLKELGIYNDALIIILSDHGEGFGEHGLFFHGNIPYEEMIQVPVIIKFPGNQIAGKRVNATCSLIDILPTVVMQASHAGEQADVVIHECVQGKDLFPLIEGKDDQIHDFVFTDTQSLEVQNRYVSVTDGRWKLIEIKHPSMSRGFIKRLIRVLFSTSLWRKVLRDPIFTIRRNLGGNSTFLFNLDLDPHESINVIKKKPKETKSLLKALESWEEENERIFTAFSHQVNNVEVDERLLKHFIDLGYID